jgi:hypothetical protein
MYRRPWVTYTEVALCSRDCLLYDKYMPFPIPWRELFPEEE